MRNKTLTHRFIKLFVLIITFLLILSSCDIIDSIFGGDEDNNTNDPGYYLIGSQVIGSTGGEIDLDSIIVKVPSGAFDENNEVNIYVGLENDGFNEYGSSALYQIDGLPSTINKPIKLNIKYHGTIEGDTLVAIGTMGYATSIDSFLYSYHAENASDSAGYLVYDLPAYSDLAKTSHPQNDILEGAWNIIVLSSYVTLPSSNGHFKLSFPLPYYQQAVLMGEHFETAYKTCDDMDFDLSARDWDNDTANVLTKPLRIGLGGFYTYYLSYGVTTTDEQLISQLKWGKFTINLDILTDDLMLRTVCGHEFLHLVQNLYEFSSPVIEPEQSWLKEATSVWIEEKYANVSNYVSPTINYRELYLLEGWQQKQFNYKNERSHAEAGYGLSVIIKGIEDRYGVGGIVKIFENIRAGTLPNNAVDPVDAILSILDEPIEVFWHGVLSSYILGQYYNSQVNFRFLDDPDKYSARNEVVYTNTVTIDTTQNNSIHTFIRTMMDLSGELFKIKPGDLSMLTTASMSFTVDDPTNCGILVCKYKKGSEITEIGNVFPGGNGEVIISDVKPIFDAGYELVVMMSNSTHDKTRNYSGTNHNVELVIELKETETPIKYVSSYFVLNNTEWKETYSATGNVLNYNTPFGGGYESVGGTSSFSNNVFSTIFDNYYDAYGDAVNGNMSVTFFENPRRLNINYDINSTGDFVTIDQTMNYDGLTFETTLSDYFYYNGEYYTMDIYTASGSSVSTISFSYIEEYDGFTKEVISFISSVDDTIGVRVLYPRIN